jgi:Zn-dependent protease
VFLAEPTPTPYDLNFRLFGVPVRVHPMFWLICVLLNTGSINEGRFAELVVWVACVFVSILVHEMGHVLMGRAFGSEANIVLYGFGGLAVGSTRGLTPWKRVAVLLAGPGAGFILYAAVWAGTVIYRDQMPEQRPPVLVLLAILYLSWINLWWGIFNLLPVWPLDGGQISAELFKMRNPWTGMRTALQISIVVGAGIALLALADYMGRSLLPFRIGLGIFGAFMFGMLAYSSYEMLQRLPRDRDPFDDSRYERVPWERDPDEWRR